MSEQKRLIEKTGMTSPALAQILDVTPQVIRDWKMGRTHMPDNKIAALLDIAKCHKKISKQFGGNIKNESN